MLLLLFHSYLVNHCLKLIIVKVYILFGSALLLIGFWPLPRSNTVYPCSWGRHFSSLTSRAASATALVSRWSWLKKCFTFLASCRKVAWRPPPLSLLVLLNHSLPSSTISLAGGGCLLLNLLSLLTLISAGRTQKVVLGLPNEISASVLLLNTDELFTTCAPSY